MTDTEVFELNTKQPAVMNEMVDFARICTGSDAKPSIWHIHQILTKDRLLQFANRMGVNPKKDQSVFEALLEQGDRRGIVEVEEEVILPDPITVTEPKK